MILLPLLTLHTASWGVFNQHMGWSGGIEMALLTESYALVGIAGRLGLAGAVDWSTSMWLL